ncbi:vesicle transport protein, partial [Pavlovales sp. CCMP2436]
MCPSLTYEQRLYGFAICFTAGVLLTLTSMFSFTKLLLGYPTDFAIKYTFGNLIAICSTGFLIGPMRQFRQMTAATRWMAVVVYFGAMVMTLVSAFKIQIAMVTVLFIIIQFCAMVWYALSYIPFGRQMMAKCC